MAKTRPAPSTSSGKGATSRLPSTRERRPALAALAVLLIVGGALASGWLAIRSGDRAFYLQVSNEVAQGQRITSGDLKSVSLPKDYKNGVPAGDKDSIVNQYATVRLLPATVLTPTMVSRTSGVGDDRALLGVTIPRSIGSGLRNGSRVALYITSSDSTDAQPGIVGEVVTVNQSSSGSGISAGGDDVSAQVSVDVSCGPALSTATKADQVVVALIGATDDPGKVRNTCGG